MKGLNRVICTFIFLLVFTLIADSLSPNIIFIYADDLGWNDVSLHGSAQIPTPNIDALAMSGILLNNYYGYWMCTPSRGAFLSGIEATKLGLQHYVIKVGERTGLPLDVVTLPQHLKNFDYSTHLVGKWHLGYMTKEYTPTYRGFDSFFGYYNGYTDYYDYITHDSVENVNKTNNPEAPCATSMEREQKDYLKNQNKYFIGIDLHDGTDTVRNFRGKYATEVFTDRAEQIIRHHDSSRPLFLYLSHLAVHVGNRFDLHQAPLKYVERVKHIQDRERRLFAATTVALDDSVGQIIRVLNEKNMLQNTIVAFISDNGGETTDGAVSSNSPLRGKKETLWEGGNRLVAALWSPLFKLTEPRISMQLMHVTDWLPTFYEAAGGSPMDLGQIDGRSMWKTLLYDQPSPRKELLYNIDPVYGMSALRIGNMKVINGTRGFDNWYNQNANNCFTNIRDISACNFQSNGLVRDILTKSGWWIIKDEMEWRRKATVSCKQTLPEDKSSCDLSKEPCLYNIAFDPCEYNNLADLYPQVVNNMMKKIEAYQSTAVEPQSKPSDPNANPACHDYAYVPWMDPEHYIDCTLFI